MPTRRSEWLETVKMVLDKTDAKRDAKKLANELRDILTPKISVDPEGLEEFVKELNNQLSKMGKQKIIFSDMTLHSIVSQIASAVTKGISDGVDGIVPIAADPDFSHIGDKIGRGISDGIVSGVADGIESAMKELDTLIEKRQQKFEEGTNLRSRIRKKEEAEKDINLDFNSTEVLTYKNKDDLKKQVEDIQQSFMDVQLDLEDAIESGKVTKKLLKEYANVTSQVIKARNTVEQLNSKEITVTDSSGGIWGQSRLTTQAKEWLPKNTREFYLSESATPDDNLDHMLNTGAEAFESLVNRDELISRLQDVEEEITELNAKIQNLSQEHPEIISKKEALEAESRINKINEAYQRLLYSREKNKGQLNSRAVKDIDTALNYTGKGSKIPELPNSPTQGQQNKYTSAFETAQNALSKLFERESQPFDDWEERAKVVVKAVKEFESWEANSNAPRDILESYRSAYEEIRDEAKESAQLLQNLLSATKNGLEQIEGGDSSKSIDDRSEELDKKAGGDNKTEESLTKQRVEQEKLVASSEKKEVADETAAEMQEKSAKNAREEQQAKEAILNILRQIHQFSGQQSKEYMSLIGTDATIDTVGGEEFVVPAEALVEQLIDNAKKSILMSLHNHPDDMLAFTPSDLASYGKLYKSQGVDVHGIIAEGIVQTIDFTGIAQETILQIAQSYSDHLSVAAQNSKGLLNYKNGILEASDELQAVVNKRPDAYKQIKDILQSKFNEALALAFSDHGLDSTVKTFDAKNLPQLAEYLFQVEQNARNAINPVEKLNALTSIKEQINKNKVAKEVDVHRDNATAINEEAQAQAELNKTKAEGEQISSVDDDDDVEVVQKENGSLEDKLELLRDIAEQYNSNITQKQRNRHEELNQKDMNEGLTPKEEERYWELGEQIEEADSALEEFEKTYDRIIVKLANGNNVEILPDDKGLRTLAKIDEEYGESYNGIEIEDVIYERIQREATVAERAVDSLNDSIEETKSITQNAAKTATTSVDGLNDSLEQTEQLEQKLSTGGAGADGAPSDDIDGLRQQLEAKDAEIAEANRRREEAEMAERVAQDNALAERHETEAAYAELEELQEQKDREIEAKDAEISQIRETSKNEKATLQNDLDLARQQARLAQDEAAASQAREAEISKQLAEQESLNQQLRESLANVKTVGGDEQASVSSEELKNVLDSITYSVKIVHDDNDKQANKIAIDEHTLEETLKRVFARELNPQIEQADSEPKNEPWALEKTLQTVKSVLDAIQTNTAKPESVEVAPAKADIGNVLATENTLAAIKTAVEAINKKVVKGTQASPLGGEQAPKQEAGKLTAYAADDDGDATSSKNNDKSMKLLADISLQRKNLEKFVVQLQTAGKLTDEYQVWIDNLTAFLYDITSTDDMTIWKKAFAITKTSVGIDDVVGRAEDKETGAAYKELIELQKTRNELELKHAKAQEGSAAKQFYAEQLAQMDQAIAKQRVIIDNDEYELKLAKMQEAQVRKLGEAEAKAADKDAKKQAADAKKMAQREAMLGKAGNAVGRAENTWMNAIGIEGELPADFAAEIDEYYQKLDALRKKHQELKNSDMISDEQKKELIAQTLEINKLTDEIGGLVSEYRKLSGDNVTVIGKDTLDSDAGLDAYNQQLKQAVMTATNGKAQIKNFDAATGTLTYTVKTGTHEFTEYTAAVRRADGALVSVQGETKKTETFFEATARKMKELTSYFSGMAVFNRIGQELRRGIQYIREIDLALTELKKVTNETEQTYDKFLKTAAKTADKLGSTMQEVISSTADFSRVGYTFEQSATLAESALTLMNTSEYTDIGSASEALISALKAYGYAAEESMHVVDIFNEIGNNYAISTNELATSLTSSASALELAGNSLEQSVALLTGGNTILQDPDVVSTSLKVISLRIRGVTSDLQEMGESVDDVVNTSKLQAKIKALTGVDIIDADGAFRSTYDILVDIGKVYNELDSMSQSGVLELLAGKQRANALGAILTQIDTVEDAYTSAMESDGSATAELEKYLDSIQGKIDQFTNAVQSMWSNALNSDLVKVFVAFGTGLIKILDNLKPIYLLISGIAVYLNKKYNFVDFSNLLKVFKDSFSNAKNPKEFFKNLINGFKKTGISIDEARAKLEDLKKKRDQLGDPKSEKNKKKYDEMTGEINAIEAEIKAYDDLIAKRDEAVKNRDSAKSQMDAANADLANAWSQGEFGMVDADELDALKKKADEATEAFKKADLEVKNLDKNVQTVGKSGKGAFTGLGKSVKAFGKQVASVITQMLVMWGITKAIELLTKLFDDMITTAAEAAEEYEKINEELNSLKDNLKTIEGELSDIDDKMADLMAKSSLTFVEQEELDRLKAEREELERTLELNQQLANQKQQQVNSQTSGQVEYYRNKGVKSGKTTGEQTVSGLGTGLAIGAGTAGLALTATGGAAGLATALGVTGATQAWNPVGWGLLIAAGIVASGALIGTAIGATAGATEEKVGESIDNMEEKLAKKEEEVKKAREKYQKSGKDRDREKYEEAQKALSNYRGEMAQYFTEIDAMYQNVDLSTIEDPDEYKRLKEEMNDFYNERDKWLITSGAEGAKSNAIGRIFDKDDYENASKTIDNLVKKLEKDPTDQSAITQISEQCKVAEKDLDAVGLSVQDAIDYFTILGQNAAFGTVEGKVAEISSATSKLQTLLSNTDSPDFTGLFGQGGEVSSTAIAEYFQDTSEATRAEIARLVKDINDDEISVENALKQFELFGIQSTIDIHIADVQTNFKDVFIELGDADGLIDTFQELGEAIGSTSDALKVFNKAEAEMANSGRVSIQTALELMEYTDDYGSILQVVDGKLHLADNAEKVLIQTRIDAIKTSAEASLADATNAHEKAKLATATYKDALDTDMSASVVASAWEKVLAAAAGLWEGIKSLLTEESWTEAYNRGYNATLENIIGYETVYDDAGLQALVDAEAEAKAAMDAASDRVELANQLTPETLETINDADDVDTKEDVAKNRFQAAMDYWENRIGANQARYEQIQNEIDLLETKGQKAGAKYYQEQIKLENQRLDLLTKQKAEAKSFLSTFTEGSDEWWEVANTLNDIESELDDVTASIQDLNDAMADTHWYMFDEAHDRLSTLTSDLENIRDILSNEKLFDDEGSFTKEGLGTLASYVQELGIYEGAMADARKEMELFGDAYDPNKTYVDAYGNNLSIDSEQDWYEAAEKAEEKYDEWNQKVVETRYNIKDLYEQQIDAVEEYTSTLVDSYNDYIDVVKDALDAERDLYEFKKSTEKKTKNIAEIERRIAALSGSTNAADVAERRKLQAELTEAKSDLDDHYYSHSKEQQSQALDNEAAAYEAAMNAFIESLYTKLEESTTGLYMSYEEMSAETKSFVDGVTESVVLNAGNVKEAYLATGETIDDCLVTPWTNAAAAIGAFSSSEGAIGLMNSWTESKTGAPFYDFQTKASNYLAEPWSAIIAEGGPVKTFEASVKNIMSQIVSNVQSNISGISGVISDLQTEINKIKDTTIRVTTVYETQGDGGNEDYNNGNSGGSSVVASQSERSGLPTISSIYGLSNSQILALGYGPLSLFEFENKLRNYDIGLTASKGKTNGVRRANDFEKQAKSLFGAISGPMAIRKHAKGTLGTTRDEWAITDEPQFGDELVLIPGKDGNISFVRKGTGIVPADLTQKLFELAQIPTSDLMSKNMTAIVPNITKNDFKNEFNFESLVHVDTVDSDTLPKLEKMVDKKIDDFSRALNYSLKKFAR